MTPQHFHLSATSRLWFFAIGLNGKIVKNLEGNIKRRTKRTPLDPKRIYIHTYNVNVCMYRFPPLIMLPKRSLNMYITDYHLDTLIKKGEWCIVRLGREREMHNLLSEEEEKKDDIRGLILQWLIFLLNTWLSGYSGILRLRYGSAKKMIYVAGI